MLEPTYRAVFDGLESQLELPLAGRDWLITVSPLGRRAGLLVATDVTERKRRERRLTELAARDVLTGAWNSRRLTQELDWLQRSGGAGSLLALDLDGFKRVNDTMGHAAGDELLRRVATAVQGCVRRADLVARIGGDEFAVFLAGATPAEAQTGGRQDSQRGRRRMAAGDPGRRVGRHLGGRPGRGGRLGRADRAMYADKRRRARATCVVELDARVFEQAREQPRAQGQRVEANVLVMGVSPAALGAEPVEHRRRPVRR